MPNVNWKSEAWMATALQERRNTPRWRALHVTPDTRNRFHHAGHDWLNFASNDYLDLAHDARLKAASVAATRAYGTGATAARLVNGNLPVHAELEERLAAHRGYPAALLFGSGYLTNAGTIPALVGRHDHIFIDRLAHASMIDAAHLGGAHIHRFAHNDPGALNDLLQKHSGGRRLVLTESVFSMDGDRAPLPELVAVAAAHEAMIMVDEAHAGGVFGPAGSGLIRTANLQNDVNLAMGTCSKALGGYGGYVACSGTMRDWLINHARAFIYTTALPPGVAAATLAALDILKTEPDRGNQLLQRAHYFRAALQAQGFDTLRSASQIVPVLVGSSETTLRLAKQLRQQHLLVGAMRPPTVPPGKARLRFSLTYAHGEADLDRAVDALVRARAAVGGL